MAFYKEKYKNQLLEQKRKHYARSKFGNKYGAREKPATVIEKSVLEDMLGRGLGLYQIADKLNTSAWFVRENIVLHGLSNTNRLPSKMQEVDFAFLERLEPFCPGITEKSEQYYEDPHAFFQNLYKAYIRLNELTWFVREQAHAHAYYVEKGTIPRDHICWMANRAEMRLSLVLLEYQIPHLRQYTFHKNYIADFAFSGSPLIVEVYGDYHKNDAATKVRDKKRMRILKRAGYATMTFTDKEVFQDTQNVVLAIQKELRRLKASKQPVLVPFGTSKLTKTARTLQKDS